jgi:hypothetical protein
MAHFVTGLFAKRGSLAAFADRHSLHEAIAMPQGFELLPLREEDIESLLPPPATGPTEGFNYLCEQLSHMLIEASRETSLVYFETEYFGGVGAQGAAVFADGALIYGPISAAIGPINEALALLGVVVTPPATDAFDAVGLGVHRNADDWLTA